MKSPPDSVVFPKGEHVVETKHGIVTVSVPQDFTLDRFARAFGPLVIEKRKEMACST